MPSNVGTCLWHVSGVWCHGVIMRILPVYRWKRVFAHATCQRHVPYREEIYCLTEKAP